MVKKLTYECSSDYQRHRESMIHLHQRSYGRVTPELYDSLYPGNPLGPPLLGLCFDEETLVGQENYIRQDVCCSGEIYKGAVGINTLVDPKYRLFYGVFGKLCKLTIDHMKDQVDVLTAFANEESKKYYLKYYQWKIATKVNVYKKITGLSGLNAESALSFFRPGKLHKDVTLEEVTKFDPEVLDPVIRRQGGHADYCRIYKTTDFLNWKYLRNKHYQVRGYQVLEQGSVSGYCLTYDDGIEKKILDFLVDRDDKKVFGKMISTLSHLSRKERKRRLVVYGTPGCWYERSLKRHLFVRRWDIDFIMRPFNERLSNGNWVVQLGDFDIF